LGGISPDRVRGEEPFEALRVSRRRTDTDIHVAATNELGLRSHADLISPTIVADGRADGVSAMAAIIARHKGIWPAGAAARVDAVVPVEIMVGNDAIPTAVMRLEGVMRPPNTGVCPTHYDALAEEAFRPYRRRVGVIDAGLDRCWGVRLSRRVDGRKRIPVQFKGNRPCTVASGSVGRLSVLPFVPVLVVNFRSPCGRQERSTNDSRSNQRTPRRSHLRNGCISAHYWRR